MNIKKTLSNAALSTAMAYISGDPEKNLPKLLNFMEGIGWDKNQTKVFHEVLDHPENNWYQFLMGLWRDIDNDVLKVTFRNFGLNASLFGYQEQRETKKNTVAISRGPSCWIPLPPAIFTVLAVGLPNIAISST